MAKSKVCVVMPAYNAARTLLRTHHEVMSTGVVDHIIVVDDASQDDTLAIARTLPATSATAATRKPATDWPWRRVPISSSWFIPITSTRPV
jgi:glycosyltransferase involved in cell wall biosynthesis